MRWWFAFSFGWGALIGLIGTLLTASSYTHAVQDAARYHRACARPAAAVAISACRYGPALLIDAESMPAGFKGGKVAYATLRLPDGRTRSVSMETDALEALHVVPAVAVETPGPGVPVTIQTWGGRIMLIAVAGHVVRTTDNPDARVRNTMEGLALFGGAALVFGALCLYVIRQGARRRRPRDPLQPTLREVLSALWHRTSPDRTAGWQARNAAALARLPQAPPAVEQDTSPLTETVVPPRVVLPRTFTERSGYFGPLGLLLFAAAFGYLQQGLPAALRWGALVCASALALSAWFSAKTRRITCTEQGITVSTRSRRTGLRQRVCLWSDVTATTYTYHRADTHYRGHSSPKATFAVETSQGTAVTISDRRSRYFEEFVAICNAHTPQLPYIWEHRQRPPFRHQMRIPGGSMSFGRVRSMDEVWPPAYFQVARDRGGP
jgi:hypothetical protein